MMSLPKPEPFEIERHTGIDKRFEIYGPDIRIFVDYDDVDHKTVDQQAEKIVHILNEHWDVIDSDQK
jgi:hypothetical protein